LLLDINHPYIQVDDKQCQECTTENRFIDKNSYSYVRERNMKVDGAEAQLGQDSMAFGPEKFLRVTNQTFVIMKNKASARYKGWDGVLVAST
jgi:hypothetical protein